jgi:hypothetical protein
METLNNLIFSLSPIQKSFTSKSCLIQPEQHITQNSNSTLYDIIIGQSHDTITQIKNLYHLSNDITEHLSIIEIEHHNNLYKSLLNLLLPKYQMCFTIEQKNQMVDEFVRFLISQIDLKSNVKSRLRDCRLHQNKLIEEIKSQHLDRHMILLYIAILFGLNIILLSIGTETHQIEIYYDDETCDLCKPFILIDYNECNLYRPLVYDGKTILTYYDHPIIPQLLDHKKKLEINAIH